MDWGREQRLRAIEIIVYWQGCLNSSDLVASFGISRNHANLDIKEYLSRYPDNFYYSPTDRTYLKSKSFKPHLTQGCVDEYIDHVSRMRAQAQVSIERLTPHHSRLKPDIIAALLDGIRNQNGISILYASMNQPKGTKRTIYPHSIVDTGFRWHVRAYCENRREFRDFNLGRILSTPESTEPTPKCAMLSKDKMWRKMVSFNLCANPNLSDNQKQVIESEFDMKRGRLVVRSRACLIHYILQRYQIDSQCLGNPPTTQLLAIGNPKSISPYLFGSN